ncbi:MAG: prolyl oligopeptidase family serine peptidase [Bacteroidales bacterium]|nr:prolyl oligopeptidase family serine peptidase [Bacteroidales bacterium]
MKKSLFLFVLLSFVAGGIVAQDGLKYQKPPEDIVEIMMASPTPSVSISPDGTTIVLTERPGMPSIEDLSREELRLGGLRIDPDVNGPSRNSYATGIYLMNIDGTARKDLKGLPDDLKLGSFSWSNDGKKFAFTNTTDNSLELWIGDVETLEVKKIDDNLNLVLGSRGYGSRGLRWMPDNRSIVYQAIIPGRGECPEPSPVPEGPVVQENLGKKGAAATFQDLLSNPVDEAIFEYYAGSVIKIWNGSTVEQIGKPGIYGSVDPSPDGKYLLVQTVEKPFSYTVPYYYFPSIVAIWDMDGNLVKKLADQPLKENLPRGYDMTFPEPSGFTWRNDKPSTVLWVKPLDDGDFEKEMEYHDQVYVLDAPFDGEPQEYLATKLRFGGITWGNDDMAIFSERSRKERLEVQTMFDPDDPMATRKEIFRLHSEDRYNNPGNFVTTENEFGRRVLLFTDRGRSLLLTGRGASPEGDRPFIDKYRIKDGTTTRFWRSEAPYYEDVADILPEQEDLVITTRESIDIPPNYFIRNLKNGKLTQITHFENPYPQLEGVSKELIKYKRNDGLDLSFELYLPKGYDKEKDGPLPAILWAYPREYQSQDAAGQVSGSPYRFIRVSPSSILVFVTQGYAIMNDAAFPIVARDSLEPNDTFRDQLVANAQAAIDKGVELGVVDPDRVAVGGHSYGAFMTANLLAHSRLFAAGLARSGAYNRTLTPFGFQNERRSFWEAPDLYFSMSPFMHADKVKDPILLIHGQADNNSGTFPIQSERYYAALKGHGAIVRLVLLPKESHGYSSAESLMHMQWETYQWLEKYVKNK